MPTNKFRGLAYKRTHHRFRKKGLVVPAGDVDGIRERKMEEIGGEDREMVSYYSVEGEECEENKINESLTIHRRLVRFWE